MDNRNTARGYSAQIVSKLLGVLPYTRKSTPEELVAKAKKAGIYNGRMKSAIHRLFAVVREPAERIGPTPHQGKRECARRLGGSTWFKARNQRRKQRGLAPLVR